MTATLATLVLSTVLLLAALGGPWVLRRTALALASMPRIATAALVTTALLWVTTLVAIGPVIAWMSRGPAWLPEEAAEVCVRCLVAATPFGGNAVSLGIPAIIPLALPALGAIAVLAGLFHEFRTLGHSQKALAARVRADGAPMTVLGHRVHVIDGAQLRAFSLPRNHGGIVISHGALAALTPLELSAVLEHEHAHISQRHHLWLTVLNGATRYFRWVPFIRAVRGAVPHYLEISADQAAKRVTGTTALASALLRLGEAAAPQTVESVAEHAVLHAAGSDRIRSLLGQPRTPASLALAAAAGAYVFMLAAAVIAVHWPYLLAVLTGC